jgi:hypothetical protein
MQGQVTITVDEQGRIPIESTFDEPFTVYLLAKALAAATASPSAPQEQKRIIPVSLAPRINGQFPG